MGSSIIVILIFLVMAMFIVVAIEIRERRRVKQNKPLTDKAEAATPASATPTTADTECCGRHAVCERNSLLSTKPEITYYDDEELDGLAGRSADTYSEAEKQQLNDVFRTLREEDVAGWLRSLQLRNIELTGDIKEEALLIVADRRFA